MNEFFRRVTETVCVLALSVAFVACAGSPEKQLSSVESAFNGFDRFQRSVVQSDPPTRTVASKINDRYRAAFSPYQTAAAVSKLGNGDLALLFRAAHMAFIYGVSARPLGDMQLDLAELRRRGIARDADYANVYASLIEIRYFDQARAFARLHPRTVSIEAVPVVADDSTRQGPTALLVRAGGSKLERRSVDLRSGRRIVVVSSPLCHFSLRAIRSIEGDAVLRPLFHEHAVWVVPADQSTPFETVAKWNRVHPQESMAVAYRREEWPMVDRWETPVFYFFREGRVVGKVIGWPIAGRKAEIRRSLRLAGLL
jgi:hypothetical protein